MPAVFAARETYLNHSKAAGRRFVVLDVAAHTLSVAVDELISNFANRGRKKKVLCVQGETVVHVISSWKKIIKPVDSARTPSPTAASQTS